MISIAEDLLPLIYRHGYAEKTAMVYTFDFQCIVHYFYRKLKPHIGLGAAEYDCKNCAPKSCGNGN